MQAQSFICTSKPADTLNEDSLLKFFRRTQSLFFDPFRLWHSYKAIGEDVPTIVLYDDDEIDLMTTQHKAISYHTEPMQTQQLKKARIKNDSN